MSYTINSSIRARYYGGSNRGNPKYIVLHYTGNGGTTATARGNANYFHTCPRKASAHYVVDEGNTIYQCVPDNRAAWSVGDSSNGHGSYYGKCTNSNSVSIEMVSHSNSSGYYIPQATINRAAELTRYLMKKYGIGIDRVIRHYDVTTKRCPEPMCGSTSKNKKWAEFKNLVKNGSTTITVTPLNKVVEVLSNDGTLNVRSGPDSSYSKLGTLKNGNKITVVGVSGNWYKIKYNNTYGYVNKVYTTAVKEVNSGVYEEEDDMKYYRTLNDVPSWYKEGVKKMIDKKLMQGDEKGNLNVSEDLCRIATILNKAGLFDISTQKNYKTLDDVPTWYKESVEKMINAGAIKGTGNGELNMSEDLCRSLTILDKAGILDSIINK